jgi:hypothetical protein
VDTIPRLGRTMPHKFAKSENRTASVDNHDGPLRRAIFMSSKSHPPVPCEHQLMDQARKKKSLQEKLERCRELARQYPEGITAKNLKELEEEIQFDLRAIE